MRLLKNRCLLHLEPLEGREVPAVLLQLDGGGNLAGVFGAPSGLVFLTQTANDTVRVTEAGTDLGTYSVAGNLNVRFGNSGAFAVVIVQLGGFDLSGSVNIALGNSTGVCQAFVEGPGSVSGDINLSAGIGSISQVGVATGLTTQGDVVVGGNVTMRVPDAGGGDIFLGVDVFGGSNAFVGGNVYASGGRSFGANSANSTVGGNVTYVSGTQDAPFVFLEAGSSVAGNVSITTRNGNDSVSLDGSIGGNTLVNLGGGANTLTVSGSILGSLSVVGGSGIDVIGLDGATIGGNLTANLGSGNDGLTFGATTPATVLGSQIYVNGGNGNDSVTVGTGGLTAPGARLTFLGGNGNDTVDFSAAAPLLASAYLDGGFGTNDFVPNASPIGFPITLRRFV